METKMASAIRSMTDSANELGAQLIEAGEMMTQFGVLPDRQLAAALERLQEQFDKTVAELSAAWAALDRSEPVEAMSLPDLTEWQDKLEFVAEQERSKLNLLQLAASVVSSSEADEPALADIREQARALREEALAGGGVLKGELALRAKPYIALALYLSDKESLADEDLLAYDLLLKAELPRQAAIALIRNRLAIGALPEAAADATPEAAFETASDAVLEAAAYEGSPAAASIAAVGPAAAAPLFGQLEVPVEMAAELQAESQVESTAEWQAESPVEIAAELQAESPTEFATEWSAESSAELAAEWQAESLVELEPKLAAVPESPVESPLLAESEAAAALEEEVPQDLSTESREEAGNRPSPQPAKRSSTLIVAAPVVPQVPSWKVPNPEPIGITSRYRLYNAMMIKKMKASLKS